jgi:membrane-associated phospholipid phosphatase
MASMWLVLSGLVAMWPALGVAQDPTSMDDRAVIGIDTTGTDAVGMEPIRADASRMGERSSDSETAGSLAFAERDGVFWRDAWEEFRWWEYVGSGSLLAASVTLRFAVAPSLEPTWTGGILFDEAVYEATRVEGQSAYDTWVLLGDIPFYASLAFPTLDVLVSAGLVHGDWKVASQLFLMNVEAYSVVAALLWIPHTFIRRERPYAPDCVDGVDALRGECDSADMNRSFPGGHVAIVSTAAALTCTHHTQLPLYGHPAADGAICGAWIGAAVLTFMSRTASSKHYLTDNLVGATIGFLAGWLLPMALHYGFGPDTEIRLDETASEPPPSFLAFPTLAPTPDGAGTQAGLIGTF